MTGRFNRGIAALGLIVTVALPVLASNEIDEARESLDEAQVCLTDKCWEDAERKANIGSLDTIAEAKRAPLLKEAADIKKACAARDPSEDAPSVKQVRSAFRRARISLDGVEDVFGKKFPAGTKKNDPDWESALSTVANVDKIIKDDADKADAGITPALKQEFDAKSAELRKRCAEAQVVQELGYAERIFQEIENPKTEKNAWFFGECLKKEPEIKQHLDKLPKDHPKVVAAYARLDKDLVEAKKNLGSAERDEAVKPAIKDWKELKEKVEKEYAGWETATCPPHVMGKWDRFHNYQYPFLKKCTDRIYDVDKFLTGFNSMDTALKSKFKDDAELQGCLKEGKTMESESAELVCKITNQLLDSVEKEAATKEGHQAALNMAKNLARELDSWHAQFAPSYDATKKRAETIVGKAEGENAAAAAKVEEWKNKLTAACDPFWTEATKHYSDGDFVKLNSHDMVLSIGSVKGKKVRFVKAPNWLDGEYANDGIYGFIVDANGPVAFKYDQGLLDAYHKGREETGGVRWNDYPGPVEDVIGVVEGTCTVDHQAYSQITRQHYKTGVQTEAVLVRVTSYKSTPWALVEGKGTNLSKIDGATDFPVKLTGTLGAGGGGVGVDPGSAGGSSSGGTGHTLTHMLHRFMAWGMCALLGLCGVLALAHGASKFVPAIQEQKVKLGDYLGYVGFGFAGIGLIWFGAALVFWVFEGNGGSLPSIAMLFAGAFTGIDVLRSKGKLKEETASMIQPLGILLGLGCFAAAAIHFLFWDWTLL